MSHTATYDPLDDKIRIYLSHRLSAEDYAPVKAAGYHSAPKQGCVFAFWSPKAEDLALELCGEIGDEDTSLVDRAEARAERFEDYSDSRKDEAERAHKAVSAIADGIPLGQPILVGHHSERHARRDAAKIENGMRRAVNAWKTSEYWKDRAASALAHAKYKELPGVRARRIKTLEAELRKSIASYTPLVTKDRPKPQVCMQQKWSECYPHDGSSLTREQREAVPEKPHVWVGPPGRGGNWAAVEDLEARKAGSQRWEDHLMHRLEYEHAMLEEAGATKLLDRKPKSAAAQLPLCNYRAPEGLSTENKWNRGQMIHYAQVEMLQADYAKIYADYKGTRVIGNSHRVRTAVIKHDHVCVFLTDSKVHVPPPPVDPKPREPRPIPTYAPKPAEPEAAKFEALAETLKAGVQVVSANQLFPTPVNIALDMAHLAGIEKHHRVLEPSAGTGRLIEAVRGVSDCELVAIEISGALCASLKTHTWAKINDIRRDDFLECGPAECNIHATCDTDLGTFDRVLMNPPFENASDIKHILHAMTFLKPGGRLVAICANGPRQNEKLKPLADSWEELPAGTFEGTGVRAVMLVINKPATLTQEPETPATTSEAPLLAQNGTEAAKMAYSGRSWPALKESKRFDSERLALSPLFDRKLF